MLNNIFDLYNYTLNMTFLSLKYDLYAIKFQILNKF